MLKQEIQFYLNGEQVTCTVDPRMSLLEMLRTCFELTGVKEGCGVGECGACTVIVDQQIIDSCIYLAVWVDGKTVKTIEGVTMPDGSLSDLQEEYVKAGAVQCGFCIPGMVLASEQLIEDHPHPTRSEIRRGLSGNMCRCTGYQKMLTAVENTVERRQACRNN